MDTGAFFLHGSTSSRIAYLGNFQGSVGMGVAGRAPIGDPVATTLGSDDPSTVLGTGGLSCSCTSATRRSGDWISRRAA